LMMNSQKKTSKDIISSITGMLATRAQNSTGAERTRTKLALDKTKLELVNSPS
jgi:hypothetical protein